MRRRVDGVLGCGGVGLGLDLGLLQRQRPLGDGDLLLRLDPGLLGGAILVWALMWKVGGWNGDVALSVVYWGFFAVLLLLAALAAWLGHVANIVWLVVFVLYMDRFQIRPEEAVLRTLFGTEYATYCARVRRWL